jgi:hypothetical protein
MDVSEVRAAAEDHAAGVVAGDLRRAGKYLAPEAEGEAAAAMKRIPRALTAAEVVSVEAEGEGWAVVIEYSGASDQATVFSLWGERAGEPRIISLPGAV